MRMPTKGPSLLLPAIACLIAAGLGQPSAAQPKIVGDPYVGDQSGIVDDPCPSHPAPSTTQTADQALIAKLHQVSRDFGQLCRYRQQDLDVLAQGKPVKVVFMGDSITDRWLPVDPSFFTGGILDRGISGQTTAQMLVRFRQDVVALKPKAVHIMAGTNDIAGNTGAATMETVQGNIKSMVELAQANGIKVMIASVLPADHFDWSPDKRPAAAIRTLNRWLKAYAAQKGFVYVDYYTPMATEQGALKSALAKDGVHPTPEGYAIMRPIAAAAVRRTLK